MGTWVDVGGDVRGGGSMYVFVCAAFTLHTCLDSPPLTPLPTNQPTNPPIPTQITYNPPKQKPQTQRTPTPSSTASACRCGSVCAPRATPAMGRGACLFLFIERERVCVCVYHSPQPPPHPPTHCGWKVSSPLHHQSSSPQPPHTLWLTSPPIIIPPTPPHTVAGWQLHPRHRRGQAPEGGATRPRLPGPAGEGVGAHAARRGVQARAGQETRWVGRWAGKQAFVVCHCRVCVISVRVGGWVCVVLLNPPKQQSLYRFSVIVLLSVCAAAPPPSPPLSPSYNSNQILQTIRFVFFV